MTDLCYWQDRCLSGWERKAAGNLVDSSTGFQGICSDTRLIEILGFHELEEVRALIREGSLLPNRTRKMTAGTGCSSGALVHRDGSVSSEK